MPPSRFGREARFISRGICRPDLGRRKSALATPQKEAIVSELTDQLSRSLLTIVTDYRGLSVTDLQNLRSQLRPHQAEFRVAKNTLTKRAAKEIKLEGLDSVLEGPTALVFAYDDVAQPAKVIRDFVRTSRVLQVKAAVLEGEVVASERFEVIADLPSRDELIAKVVGGVAAPMYGLVNVLSGPARSLAYVLQARVNQLEQAA